jgi:Ni,Fe-hydrogenase maturation factor
MFNDKIKILVFGNLLVKEDSLPLRILPKLRKEFPEIEFKELDAVEEIENEGKVLIILDSAKDIENVVLLDDIDKIQTKKIYSMHDFDVGMMLKLLKKMKKINSVNIIAVPVSYDEKKAFEETKKILACLIKRLS